MARYADADHTCIIADVDGQWALIPVDQTNRHYQRLLASGVDIASYVAPTPPAIRTISPRAFLHRLPMAKRKTIVSAVGTSATVVYWLHFTAAGPVNLDHPDTISGIDELTAAGLLDRADKSTLLADGTVDELP